jgi:hypothetical protein
LIGESDLKRRWERTLESIAYLTKLEDLLGLRESLPNGRHVLTKDTKLFQRYFDETEGIASERKFKEEKMKGRNMYTAMRKVYAIFLVVGVVLLFVPQFLVV